MNCDMLKNNKKSVSSKPFVRTVIQDKVCIAQNVKPFSDTKKFRCFQPGNSIKYNGFCDDFGPMSISSVVAFIELLEKEMQEHPDQQIVYIVDSGRRALTNAVFLLGCYLILKMERTSADVQKVFSWLKESLIEPYRDATYVPSDFGLELMDCWQGLERGKRCGWIAEPTHGLCGMVDISQYQQYDDPMTWDLHEVIPKKFIAFRGPSNLKGKECDDSCGYRAFSPGHYVDVFHDLGVSTVVRLNEPEYDPIAFTAQGIRHHTLHFDDCTAPPAEIVSRFFAIVDASPGTVAVHCKAGLGRTGTLIAAYMMRSCGFSAREAIGWLRIMRPGCVIGEQQHYLCTSTFVPHHIPTLPWTGKTPPPCDVSPTGDVEHNCKCQASDIGRGAACAIMDESLTADVEHGCKFKVSDIAHGGACAIIGGSGGWTTLPPRPTAATSRAAAEQITQAVIRRCS